MLSSSTILQKSASKYAFVLDTVVYAIVCYHTFDVHIRHKYDINTT